MGEREKKISKLRVLRYQEKYERDHGYDDDDDNRYETKRAWHVYRLVSFVRLFVDFEM